MRRIAVWFCGVWVVAGLSSCSLTELRNTNRRLKEANDRLVSENNRLEQELAGSEREVNKKDKDLAKEKDQMESAPNLASTSPAKPSKKAKPAEFVELPPEVEVTRTARGTWISMPENITFQPGQAILSGQGKMLLEKIARQLNSTYRGKTIRVEGHTDDLPVRRVRSQYPSNWELSTARACAVVRHLVDAGKVPPQRIYPAGYSYFKPKAPNSSSTARSKNRRVEILISDSDM